MTRDYIRFTGKTLEAEGRCALPALYVVLGLKVLLAALAVAAVGWLSPIAWVRIAPLLFALAG